MSLGAGAALRLSHPTEIEYKSDEKTLFEITQTAGRTEPWPMVGMVSGAALRNPPLSLWVPTILARASGANDPVSLARAIAVLNLLALAVVFGVALLIPSEEREAWLWAGALVCVSPMAMIFDRKIWAQSLLPIFCILFIAAWLRRGRPWGAFFWGLLGALLGQIHMSGFFFAFAAFLGSLYQPRRMQPLTRVRWRAWLAGSSLGVLPLLPWLHYLSARREPGHPFQWGEVFVPRFWAQWIDDSLGLQMNYTLGSTQHWDWMRYPLVGGTGTYVVALGSAFLVVAGLRALWVGRARVLSAWDDSSLLRNSALIVMGILITLSGLRVHRHYLIVTFPLEWLWLSQLLLGDGASRVTGRRWLMAVVIAQLLLSASLLDYLHQNHGAETGDYGTAYAFQPENAKILSP